MGSYIKRSRKKIHAIFPKPLDKFESKAVADEFGLTCCDRRTLQNGWAIIKQRQRKAALAIYVNLFTEHEQLYEKFRYNNKLNIQSAGKHKKNVLNIIQIIIENLDNASFVKSLIKEIALKHRQAHVTSDEWRLYTNEVKKFFLKALNESSSPSFVYALDKLIAFISASKDD
ncbi:cytoglobin-1-like [Eurosta solidaginis]|uniref:cytoglobin-1-like n=1 Tax=Eurosta solidaginis TaxID=178769 RepID=UPI0035311A2D